jgi:tartrate-resistant acid phosphatase type 5
MKAIGKYPLFVVGLLALLAACAPLTATPPPVTTTEIAPSPTVLHATMTTMPVPSTLAASQTAKPEPSATPNPSQRFAVIGDFGEGNQAEADVAGLVHGWNPDIIITVGDNNYPIGAADMIDAHVGQYYHDFISPYKGRYGPGATENRFFPTLGNHDWYTAGAKPYLDYFSLPGNERYYEFVRGPVHFFALDSDENEPDGVNLASIQAAWLQHGLAASTSPWNIVYFHYPPYSSGKMHGSTTWMRWPFKDWGVDAVLSGHEHNYERLLVDRLTYFVNGVGGGGLYNFGTPLPESQFRYNADYGAMLVTASGTDIRFEFYNRTGKLIDQYKIQKP